jgi:hypothetical protein
MRSLCHVFGCELLLHLYARWQVVFWGMALRRRDRGECFDLVAKLIEIFAWLCSGLIATVSLRAGATEATPAYLQPLVRATEPCQSS